MFHDPAAGGTDASKVCLVHLVEHLKRRGFALLDIQWITRHLRRFGAVEIPRRRYMRMLASALDSSASWSSGHEKAPSRSTRG
jgi:leucyl/phenylalanyl-tRNA--protein transferase